jgi:5-methylthioadenosine/S-adenosylhomocysteine deaminase
LKSERPEARVIDVADKLLVPGFVNAHFHTESLLLQHITDGVPLSQWTQVPSYSEAVNGLLRRSTDEEVTDLYRSAATAHLSCGTTCVGEFGLSYEEARFQSIMACNKLSSVRIVTCLRNGAQIKCVSLLSGKRPAVLVYACADDEAAIHRFAYLARSARELNVGVFLHLAEQHADGEPTRKRNANTSVTMFGGFGMLQPNSILAHVNHATERDIDMIEKAGASVVVSPLSSTLKQTMYPALKHLLSSGVRICLGTDWANADLMEEMRFIARLHLMRKEFPPPSSLEILRMATINGAVALGLSSEIGSLERGKRADMAVFDLCDVHLPTLNSDAGAERLADIIVRKLNSRHLWRVMVDGKFCYEARQSSNTEDSLLVRRMRTLIDKYNPIASRRLPRTSPHKSAEFESGTEHSFTEKIGIPAIELPGESRHVEPKPRGSRPLRLPELPQNTRRVFGDDEELE